MSALMGLLAKDWPQTDRRKALASMAFALKGRGSEPFASWTLESEPIALGIRELVTRDLTPDGRQPALSSQKPIAVILDGIISNAAILRRDLEEANIRLRGYGDAELLAEVVATFGLNRTLQRLEGSFAFALWDGDAQALHLVRDRMGGKPLYVTKLGGAVAFASTPDAFTGLSGFQKQLNPDAIGPYLAYGYSEGTSCLLKNVVVLPPGHRLMLTVENPEIPSPESWWNPATALEEIALRGSPAIRLERLLGTLANEATAVDTPFLMLDDGSQEARNFMAHLGQKAEKPLRNMPLQTPDAVSVQSAFEGISALPLPAADPDACLLAHTFKTHQEHAGCIVLASCPSAKLEGGSTQNPRFAIPRPFGRMAARLMPRQFGHLAADDTAMAFERYGYWPSDENPAQPHFNHQREKPRLSLSQQDTILFFGLEGPLRHNRLPLMDVIAGIHNIDLRIPLADHRLLEHQIPTLSPSKADIAAWMRGPLRIRMQNTLNNMYFEMLQIQNKNVIISHWQKCLTGESQNVRALWAWLTLCTWATAQKLT